MKLYVCWGTFRSPRPGGHPCRNALEALQEAGYEPEVVLSYGLTILPDGVFNQTTGRKRAKELTGSRRSRARARRRHGHRRLQGDRRVGEGHPPSRRDRRGGQPALARIRRRAIELDGTPVLLRRPAACAASCRATPPTATRSPPRATLR